MLFQQDAQQKALHWYANLDYCNRLMDIHSTPERLARALRWVPVEIRLMLIELYARREDYEFCVVLRDSMSE